MGYVPGYKHDIFISYAHFDNEVDSQDVRWVSRFQLDLKNALRQRLGQEPDVFFDTRSFEAHEHVDRLLENARASAVFLAIFSPSYVSRDFTIGELKAFHANAPDAARIVTVELLPVEEEQNHPLLRGRKRTPFWWKDAAEQDIPLRLTPKFNPEMYNARLQILAHQIRRLLVDLRVGRAPSAEVGEAPVAPHPVARPAEPAVPRGRTVLLAQSTDDLYDDRERVRAHLEQFGVKVVPENDFPQGGADFATAFEAELGRAGIFVQLLGGFASRHPPDLPQGYARYQVEAAAARGLRILQWRRPDLDPATVTHRDKALLEGPDVLAIGLEEFKGEILRRATAEPKPEPQQIGDCHFFINADRIDKELADRLLKLFENNEHWSAARPLFEGSAKDVTDDLEANLLQCGVLLLLYGNAPPAWVRAQLLRWSKLERLREEPPRLKTIVLGPPAPKPEIAWSGGFQRIDGQDGSIEQRVRAILAGLRA
jgi:hypothetical protein